MLRTMCRYLYIYFSNCSHQTFVLLDCCTAADVRTVVDDDAVAKEGPKIHSRWEQKYSCPASEFCPPNDFHGTAQSWREAQNECEQSVGLSDYQKRVSTDDRASRYPGCHPSLSKSDVSQDVASDHPIDNAPLSDGNIRARCRSGDTLTAGTSLPTHLQHPQEMKTVRRSGSLASQMHHTSREVRSASASTVKASVASTLESSNFNSGRDGTEDVVSHLQSVAIDTSETGRIHRKMPWAAQAKDELQAGSLPQQPPTVCEASAPPRMHELLGRKTAVRSCGLVSEVKDRRIRKSESAIHEGQGYAIQPSPVFNSSHHVRSGSEEGVSNIKVNARVKHDRGPSLEDGLSSSAMNRAVVPGSGPAIPSGDKHTQLSATTKQSERSQGAAGTLGLRQDKLFSRRQGSTPSEQLLKGNNKAIMSNASLKTDDKFQTPIRDNTLEEHNVNDQGRARSSVTESGPIEMTWAQRVRAGGSKSTIPRNPERKLPGQNPLHNPSTSGSSPPRSGFHRGPSKDLSVASVSDVLQVSSPPAEKRALPTVSSKAVQILRSDGLRTSQSNGSLPRALHQAASTLSSSHERGQVATGSIRHAQIISPSSDKTAWITSPGEGSDENLRKSVERLVRPTLNGMHVEKDDDDESEWHVVTRKNRGPQTAKPSKSTRRRAKSSKRLPQPAPTAPTSVQKVVSSLPTPKISPSFPPRSSFSPSSECMSTLLKPSYAAVASLRSPVISVSPSTTSSADALFVSAPQSPEHHKPGSDMVLGSPESSENYFSAPEDSEEVRQSPTRGYTSEGHSAQWEATAATVLTETDKVLTTLAKASRDAYEKEKLAAEETMKNSTPLEWADEGRSIIRHRHSSEHLLRKSAAESLGETDKSEDEERKLIKGSSFDPVANNAPSETSHKRARGAPSNTPEHPALSQSGRRFSNPIDPLEGPMAAKQVPAKETLGFRNGSEAISSHRNLPEDEPLTPTREKESYLQGVNTRLTEATLPALEGSAAALAPKAPTKKTSTRSQKPKKTKHTSKPDTSSRITPTPSPPQAAKGPQVSPLRLLASPPNVFASPPSHNTPQNLPSETPRRGRPGDRPTHDATPDPNPPRETSILRASAPPFTPQTTPSKSRRCSTFQSPASSLTTHMPEETVHPLDLNHAPFAPPEYGPTPPQRLPVPGVRDEGKQSILTPWMSRDFWLPKGAVGVGIGGERECLLGRRGSARSERREETGTAEGIAGRVGRIRRLRPCGAIRVEMAVEQIGMWCPGCRPD